MKKELKSGILSADKSADCRPTVGGVNVIAVLQSKTGVYRGIDFFLFLLLCWNYIKKYSRPIGFLYFYRPINIILSADSSDYI